jgi:hypothetical protein
VELAFPDGHREPAVASVEEITRPGETAEGRAAPERGLLLTHADAAPVPAGTQVFLLEGPAT